MWLNFGVFKIERGHMKMIYQNPIVESVIGKRDFYFTAFAQSAVINLCQGAGGDTLELVNGQIEDCSGGGPTPGDTAQITCAEDGAHLLTIDAVNPGSGSCIVISVSVTPDFPPVCTVTGLSVNGGPNQCLTLTESIGS